MVFMPRWLGMHNDFTYATSAFNCSSLTSPWKVGMTGLNPLTTLAPGSRMRFANVIFVGSHGAAVLELHGLAEDSLQVRAAALRVDAMAGDAAEFGENFFSGGGERAGRCRRSSRLRTARVP